MGICDMCIVVLGLLSTLTGGLPTIHIDPTKGNTKLRQVANLNETQVYPIPIYVTDGLFV